MSPTSWAARAPPPTSGWRRFRARARRAWPTVRADRTAARTAPRRPSSGGSSQARRRHRRGADWLGAELGMARLDGRAGARAATACRACARPGRPHRRAGAPRAGEPACATSAQRPGRAGPHGRQEARADPRGRGLACPRRAAPSRSTRAPGLRLRPLGRSTTTPGWPTRRSTPTSAGRPARASSPGRPPSSPPMGIARIERVMTDNAFTTGSRPTSRRPWPTSGPATS